MALNLKALANPQDKRELAQKTLELMMVLCRAKVGIVYRCVAGKTDMFASQGAYQQILDLAIADWRYADGTAPIIHGGRTFLFLPCARDGEMIGFAYLADPEIALPPARLKVLLEVLTEATVLGQAEPEAETQSARDRLLWLLRQNDWNIARVARLEGVTRKTIYDWLEKYQIPREKVRLKPRPA